ncbi:mitofusin-1 isoform X4 [Oncorhynchus mykiss]|uniref:mitofusin-1 isoform X4 n=1 Tax=Oncorhynchus mykiss TaxID=8022 RepID=UPI001877682C|nr:mitofusin-1 isoform X4 [Oncorhynchus mykiss]
MDPGGPSPLMHFVVAKKTINGIFDQLLEYVKEGSEFVDETWRSADLEQVAVEEQCLEIQTCARKLATIREVLARRHMKVAFFGRTSNGKSTVINAMLRDRVLPSGIGHTTNCFLRVEGTDGEDAYLTTEGSDDRKSVKSVNQLAHALHMERSLDSGCQVKVFWPKSRCALLRDDLVIMDSPGTDVTSYLDSWIDKFCLDADVFVLVGNAESTLMNTEKLFFHKVSERISKPNIFILHNRWDASAWEPEYIDELPQVRKQHMDRCVSFLVEELRVVRQEEAPGRIFFVSAKEVLSSRMHCAQGMPETGGALAEGFHERLREFQRFERTFEEFISHSAVKTKFEQHTLRAWQITEAIKAVMDAINIASAERKIFSLEDREDQKDRLEFVRGQLNRLTENIKEKINTITDEVAAKKLMMHVEERMSTCLAFRCSTGIIGHMQSCQKNMIENIRPLLPPDVQEQFHIHLPSRKFVLTYDLNLATLCADFQENIDFQFSLGWTALVSRFIGPSNAKRALTAMNQKFQNTSPTALQAQGGTSLQDHMVFSMATGVVSLTSRASMTVLVIGGVVWRSVGWRLIALSATLYGLLYLYEKLTWTNASRERALKQQFVEFAIHRLRAIIPFTSGSCSQQVHQELATTFAHLCQRVDLSEVELEGHIRLLSGRIQRLENVQRRSKTLRHRATDLESQLEAFSAQYLQNQC